MRIFARPFQFCFGGIFFYAVLAIEMVARETEPVSSTCIENVDYLIRQQACDFLYCPFQSGNCE
jgi:hypothetical protein